eukprot:gene7225-9688_t
MITLSYFFREATEDTIIIIIIINNSNKNKQTPSAFSSISWRGDRELVLSHAPTPTRSAVIKNMSVVFYVTPLPSGRRQKQRNNYSRLQPCSDCFQHGSESGHPSVDAACSGACKHGTARHTLPTVAFSGAEECISLPQDGSEAEGNNGTTRSAPLLHSSWAASKTSIIVIAVQ